MATFAAGVISIQDRGGIFGRGNFAMAFSAGLPRHIGFVFDLVIAEIIKIVVTLIAVNDLVILSVLCMRKARRWSLVSRHSIVFDALNVFLRQGKRNGNDNQDHR